MSKHKKEKAKVKFVGLSSDDVTGSAHLVSYKDENILLECGYYQCKDKMKQYRMNSRNLGFKAKELTCVLLMHHHLDHMGLIARLYHLGCKADLYATLGTRDYLRVAMEDGLKIQDADIAYLSKKSGKEIKPLYTRESVEIMLEHIIEVDFNSKVEISKYFNIELKHAYHILNSAQLELYIKDKPNNYSKKIYYSSDLGNISLSEKPFVEPFQYVKKADIAIVETTYAMNKKKANKKVRDKDLEKIMTVIREVNIEKKKGNTIIASFATQRLQELLILLYDIYENDKDFKTEIIVDTPLGIKMINHFLKYSNSDNSEKLKKAIDWKNVKLIDDWKASERIRNNEKSKIIIACSGFGDAGMIRAWMKSDLKNKDSTFVFVGYSSPESTSGQIKSNKKYILVDGEKIPNKAKVANLLSFTSHIQHQDMLDYYSSLNVREIYLVHGEMSKRLQFAQLLEDEYRKKNKTTKVFIGSRDLEIEI